MSMFGSESNSARIISPDGSRTSANPLRLRHSHESSRPELTVVTGRRNALLGRRSRTIPKPIRDSLGMKTGDRMSFTLMPGGVVVMRVKNKRVSELEGLLYKKGRKPVPIELLSR
jgi:antitoxin PrlF